MLISIVPHAMLVFSVAIFFNDFHLQFLPFFSQRDRATFFSNFFYLAFNAHHILLKHLFVLMSIIFFLQILLNYILHYMHAHSFAYAHIYVCAHTEKCMQFCERVGKLLVVEWLSELEWVRQRVWAWQTEYVCKCGCFSIFL